MLKHRLTLHALQKLTPSPFLTLVESYHPPPCYFWQNVRCGGEFNENQTFRDLILLCA